MKSIVTQDRVNAAAQQLLAQNKDVTIINIQAEIGGGSYTTIKRFLSVWEQQQQDAHQQPRAPLPDVLTERAAALARELWNTATDHAQVQVTQLREETQRDIEVARTTLAQAEAAITRQEAENEALSGELDQVRQALATAQTAQQVAETRSVEHEAFIADLRQQLAQAQAAMTERARLEGEVRALIAQLHERDQLLERLVHPPHG